MKPFHPNNKWHNTKDKLPADKQKVTVNYGGKCYSARYHAADSTFFIFSDRITITSAVKENISWLDDVRRDLIRSK